jgi:DNA-binding NtrC family response regulator
MGVSILIVEDEFLEANNLQIMLESAGYSVSDIARSVVRAKEIIIDKHPDIVLIDIILTGQETGIDLARWLDIRGTPFIFISANSNESILNAAKLTQPDGFLVKPFRERDVLVTLEVALFRHREKLEIRRRQQTWLSSLLLNISEKELTLEQRLLWMARAFQPFMQYDFILIETNMESGGMESIFGFQRVNYDDYNTLDTLAFFKHFQISNGDLEVIRHIYTEESEVIYYNDQDFLTECKRNKINEHFRSSYGIESGLMVPIVPAVGVKGAISLLSRKKDTFNHEHLRLITDVLPLLVSIIGNMLQDESDSIARRRAIEPVIPDIYKAGNTGMVGKSPNFLFVLDQIKQVAPYDTSVLILGETGVGKEGIVETLHQLSPRNGKPLIKINCAAIPYGVVESELFGHEKGAYTDARERRIGKFEQAQGGTIFLDEIGEIPLDVQTKLLRVLQEKEIERVGGRATIKVDVRIVAATNRDLYKEVAEGNFRLDLYYRMFVFPIQVPPLRERKDDIPLLTEHFLLQYAAANGSKPKRISAYALSQLVEYSWPGNIRELQYLIERHVVMTPEPVIESFVMPAPRPVKVVDVVSQHEQPRTIEEVERDHIMRTLQQCNGRISGQGGAAGVLKIPASSLRLKMKKLGIEWQHDIG